MADERAAADGAADLKSALQAERALRRDAEEALRQAEQRANLLIEGVKDYAIFTLDVNGRITSWNKGAMRLFGYETDEILGRPADVTFTEEDRRAQRPRRELEAARASGSAADENWSVRKDGSCFWASGFTNVMRDESGALVGYVKIARDLTERRRADQALRESEWRLRVALSAARMGIWHWNVQTDHDILDENLCRLLGLPADSRAVKMADFLALIHPDDRAGVAEAFRLSAEEGRSINLEFRVVWPDGSVHWLRDQGDVLRGPDGRPLYLTGACVDISDRKRMEEELREAHDGLERRVAERTAELLQAQQRALQAERLAAIGQTMAGLAHESRNLMQNTQSCLERLAWRLHDQPEALALASEIQRHQDELHQLFEDVRAYAAPVVLKRDPTDLPAVWREAWARAVARHPDRDGRLDEETAGVDLQIDADAFRMRQVFCNIFDNALAASPAPARVSLRCSAAELDGRPALQVAVRDAGPGLDEEQRRRLFEPFYTTKTKGTGLGMAIAQRIVEAHGGRIGIGDPDSGAEIIVVLPRSKE